MLFSKKKEKPIIAMYYEGLPGFSLNLGCAIEIADGNITFINNANGQKAHLKSEQVVNVSYTPEREFMLKYHNADTGPINKKNIAKWYIIITYTANTAEVKYIAFWVTSFEIGKIRKYLDEKLTTTSKDITL